MGGGAALAKVSKKLEANKANEAKEAEYVAGYSALVEALKEPLKQIAKNAGKDEGVVVAEVLKGGANSGYDALNDTFVTDMFEAGIIDPVKVTRSGIQNAASAAAILLTTEVAVADEPKEEKEAPAMGGGMPGGMDY